MSRERVSSRLRNRVAARANWACEYCRISEDDTAFGCEVDHVIAVQHEGPTTSVNLAYACLTCNRAKGTNVATVDRKTKKLVRLFNPRRDSWGRHFALKDGRFVGKTAIGKATIRLLGLNDKARIEERRLLMLLGTYPG